MTSPTRSHSLATRNLTAVSDFPRGEPGARPVRAEILWLCQDAAAGAFVDVFDSGSGLPGGLNGPDGLAFGPDGLLYVTTQGSVAVDGAPNFTGTQPSSNFVGGLSFGRGGKLYSVGFDLTDPATPGAILRYHWKSNQLFPGPGESGATFVGPTNDLVRPIGILALPRP